MEVRLVAVQEHWLFRSRATGTACSMGHHFRYHECRQDLEFDTSRREAFSGICQSSRERCTEALPEKCRSWHLCRLWLWCEVAKLSQVSNTEGDAILLHPELYRGLSSYLSSSLKAFAVAPIHRPTARSRAMDPASHSAPTTPLFPAKIPGLASQNAS
jgi:hypothetical protein